MFAAQQQGQPGGSPDIKSAISVLRQRLGNPYGKPRPPLPGAGPQGIDPSQITSRGGQQGIVGRGGNFQPLGAAAQGRLNQAPTPGANQVSLQAPTDFQRFIQQNPGVTFAGTPGPGGISMNPADPLPPQRTDMPGSKTPQWQSATAPGQIAVQGGTDMDQQQRQQGFVPPEAAATAMHGAASGGATGAPGMPPQLLQQLQQFRGTGGASPFRSLVAGALGNQTSY